MALNLWKAAGKPTAYNPLPNQVYHDFNKNDFTLRFKAKSASGARLRVYAVPLDVHKTLSSVFESYEMQITGGIRVNFIDADAKGDIIITDIELVEKPLPKLTINGIDGFLSGKWTIHAKAKVIDDETLEHKGYVSGAEESYIFIPVLPNTNYRFYCSVIGGTLWIENYNSAKTFISTITGGVTQVNQPISFKTPSNGEFIKIAVSNGNFTFKRPILNLGTTPAPYEKKRGDKMVEPVPKKNLFNNNLHTENTVAYTVKIPVKPSTSYATSHSSNMQYYNVDGTLINTVWLSTKKFTTPNNAYFVSFRNNDVFDVKGSFQLEEGTSATPYEPYAVQMNKRPAKPVAKQEGGLRMDGNYLQLPSMTMDSIEIDCLIENRNRQYENIMDARTGLANGFVTMSYGNLFAGSSFSITGFKHSERTVIKATRAEPFTDDVSVFAGYTGAIDNAKAKGILYAVRCYLNGAKVYELDFTNPNSVVGDKVLQNAKNLIPSFEDSRWQLHANARVYGADVLRLEATVANQKSLVEVQVNPNSNYLFTHGGLGVNGYDIYRVNSSGVKTWIQYIDKSKITYNASTLSDTVKLSIEPTNGSAGTFDFIKPQLYELSGSEGTVYGAPTRGLKPAKRTLYNRR